MVSYGPPFRPIISCARSGNRLRPQLITLHSSREIIPATSGSFRWSRSAWPAARSPRSADGWRRHRARWAASRARLRDLVLRQPGGDAVAELAVCRPVVLRHQVLVERAQHDQHVVAAASQQPISRWKACHWSDASRRPNRSGSCPGRRWTRALCRGLFGPRCGIVCRRGGNGQRDLRQRVSVGVWVARRIAAVLLERPARDALLVEIGVLQMAHPVQESRRSARTIALKPLVGIGPVAGNPRRELRHEPGMVELLFLFGAQVGLGAGHPEHVAVHDHFLVAQRLAVVVDQALPCASGNRPLTPAVDEAVGRARPRWFRKCDKRAVRQRRIRPRPPNRPARAPSSGSATWLQPPLVEPVVFAELVGNAVVGPGVEPLDPLPDPGRQQQPPAPAMTTRSSHCRALSRISLTPKGTSLAGRAGGLSAGLVAGDGGFHIRIGSR